MSTPLTDKMAAESALVVIVPEAEDLVGRYRILYDPSAAVGVPAHVTILYPFKPPHELSADVVETLAELFSPVPTFHAALREIRRFPDVLYLAPEPDESFRRLTQIAAARFPETPPYGGQFADVIPHLTVADVDDQPSLEAITSDFHLAAAGRLPIHTLVREITLMENTSGRWQVRHRFHLGR